MNKKILTALMAIILIIALIAVGCSKKNDEASTMQQSPDESANQQELASQQPVIVLINEEGNYILQLPDSWIGKVTYEKQGTKTIISHITSDANQAEINPVIVEIISVNDGSEHQGEFFLQLDDYAFYRSIRFDMPYTEGSDDAKVFSELYEQAPATLSALQLIVPSNKELTIQPLAETNILNQEGNYQIPVTDDWLGKVFYEIDGTKTTFYHITQDADELEINPTLLVVDVAPVGSDAMVSVFMEIAGIEYYHIPRFDFPYSEGSADAIEFSLLYEDIPTMLQSFWLIDDSAWQGGIQDLIVVDQFSQKDAFFSDIYIGDIKEAVLAKVGQPISSEVEVWEATGEVRDIYEFSFGQLVFSDDKLVLAQITDMTYQGPRGLVVDMDINQVRDLFVSEAEYRDYDLTIYYRQNGGGDLSIIVPPSAILHDGAMQTMIFTAFPDGSNPGDMSTSELEEDYMFMEQYELVCEFNVQSIMTSFTVSIGTPSE